MQLDTLYLFIKNVLIIYGGINIMENVVIKELNWKEKIIVMVFTKTFKKVYNVTRICIVNKLIN